MIAPLTLPLAVAALAAHVVAPAPPHLDWGEHLSPASPTHSTESLSPASFWKSVDEIQGSTGHSASTLHSQSFWKSVKDVISAPDQRSAPREASLRHLSTVPPKHPLTPFSRANPPLQHIQSDVSLQHIQGDASHAPELTGPAPAKRFKSLSLLEADSKPPQVPDVDHEPKGGRTRSLKELYRETDNDGRKFPGDSGWR